MKHFIKFISTIGLLSISQFAHSDSITDTYTTGDTLTTMTLNNIKSAVNDNDTRVGGNATAIGVNTGNISTNGINIGINSGGITAHDARITDLEGASPATGRIALTVSDGTPTKPLVDAVSSSATSTAFPTPSDYVAGGTVTIKALVSGCGGSNAHFSISRNGVSVGSNPLFTIVPSTQTISIPAGGASTFFVVEVTTTTNFLSDLNFVTLTRFGADINDTCSSALVVRGYIVEYPRG